MQYLYELIVCAGLTGKEPLLVKEVYALALVKQERDWQHTASILSSIHNALSSQQTTPADHNIITLARNKTPGKKRGLSVAQAKEVYRKLGGQV